MRVNNSGYVIVLYLFLNISIYILTCSQSWGLPIDWHGVFGISTTLIDNFRRIDKKFDQSNAGGGGSQEVPLAAGNHANASFQSYLFRLNPVLVINDSASIVGEISSGYARGGMLGDNSVRRAGNEGGATTTSSFGNALYGYNTTGDNDTSDIILTKAYAELYSDTATYILGRHSSHWALGALVNDGKNTWDRHTYVRDGITVKVKIGNFHISPYWAKIHSGNDLTRASNTKEYGFSLLYDNIERDIAFGILYGKKKNNSDNNSVFSDITDDPTTGADAAPVALQAADVKIIDLYLKKSFGKFTFAAEVPILTGDIGYLYSNTIDSKYKTKAIILESKYNFNNNWKMGLDIGVVDGDNGGLSTFEAMFLNPNYQIAHLLFRYNMYAVSDNTQNVYDSYITNAKFIKIHGEYKSERWAWNAAFIYAMADEVAKGGGRSAYNHSLNKTFTSQVEQSDDMGFEIDLGGKYFWNSEITIEGILGYHFVGEYFSYTNDANVRNNSKNSWIGQISASIDF